MRLNASRSLPFEDKLQGSNIAPAVLKERVTKLIDYIDDVTNILREMGAKEDSISVNISAGYGFGLVSGNGEKEDE